MLRNRERAGTIFYGIKVKNSIILMIIQTNSISPEDTNYSSRYSLKYPFSNNYTNNKVSDVLVMIFTKKLHVFLSFPFRFPIIANSIFIFTKSHFRQPAFYPGIYR